MENKERKNFKGIIAVLAVLLVCAIGSTVYFYLESEKQSGKETVITKNDKTEVNAPSDKNTTNTIIQFDGSKALNSSTKDYAPASQGNAGIYVSVDSTQKELTFTFNPSRAQEFYNLRWSTTINATETTKINFTKKIIDVFFGGMGQDMSGDTLFILLEDGTVEYIPLVHMFNSSGVDPISYGKIAGVTDVTKFVLATSNGGTGVTTLAVKADGTFYDLWYALKDTGNY